MKNKIIIFFIILTFISCNKDEEPKISVPDNQPGLPVDSENPEEPEAAKDPEILSFSIDSVEFTLQENTILGTNREEVENKSELVATFTAEGIVKVNGIEQGSGVSVNDFTTPVIYSVTNSDGKVKEYIVRYSTFTGLPKLYVTTENEASIRKEEYINASFKLNPNLQVDSDVIEIDGKIRGRGNTSWRSPKKPYRIKLESKTGLLNLAANKDWVLLANYADKSLMRNYLAFSLAKKLEAAPYAPAHQYVEVFLNGVHKGNYLLTDQIEVSSSRVNIKELSESDNDEESITGGYLLEIDQRILSAQNEPYFESSYFPVVVKSPETPSALQMQYISGYIKDAEEALNGPDFSDVNNGFRKFFDEESMIRWFIVSEIFKNVDSRNFSSIYFFKDRGGKLTMGPLWDFDLSAGNASHCSFCMDATGWHVMNNPWFRRMYEDLAFKAKVKDMWNQYKSEIYSLLPEINELTELLGESQKRNFLIWPNFNDPKLTVQNIPDFESHVNYLHDFLEGRINWIDSELNK